jgi:hypothetical protein
MKRLVLVTLVALGLAAAPKAAQAAVIIDFSSACVTTTNACGIITPLSGGNASGVGLTITTMTALNTPLNGGSYAVGGAANGGLAGSLDFNTVTGEITITGYLTIGGTNIGSAAAPVVLLSGTFSSFSLTFPVGGILSFSGTGVDFKNRTLLEALGLSASTPFQFFGFSIAGQAAPGGVYEAFSTDISNTAVPEPGSMMLLGVGLLGLAALARRRMRKA